MTAWTGEAVAVVSSTAIVATTPTPTAANSSPVITLAPSRGTTPADRVRRYGSHGVERSSAVPRPKLNRHTESTDTSASWPAAEVAAAGSSRRALWGTMKNR